MISFGNTAKSYSGLIPLKTSHKKRVELFWAIVCKKNFINLYSAAFVTVFGVIWSMPTNFAFFKNSLYKCFYKFENPEINRQLIYPASFKNTENKEGFQIAPQIYITNFSPRFCVYK